MAAIKSFCLRPAVFALSSFLGFLFADDAKFLWPLIFLAVGLRLPSSTPTAILRLLAGVIFVLLTATCCGAPVVERPGASIAWAFLVSSFCMIPLFTDWETALVLQWPRVRDPTFTLVTSAWCGLAGTWLGTIPIPLDMDVSWQHWPTPCIYGLYVGHGVGWGAAAALAHYYESH